MMLETDPEARWWRHVAKLLREARKARGLTQEQAAKVIGLSRTSYTNIERGKQRLQLWPFVKLCKALEVSPSVMLPPSVHAQVRAEMEPKLDALEDERHRREAKIKTWYSAGRRAIDEEFKARVAKLEAKVLRP